jgi:hypothetical protein
MSHRAYQSWLFPLVVWVLSTAYTASYVNRGVPHDEGALAPKRRTSFEGRTPIPRLR